MKWIASLLPSIVLAANMVFLTETDGTKTVGLSQKAHSFETITNEKLWSLYPDIDPSGKWVTFVEGTDQKDLRLIVKKIGSNTKEVWGKMEGFILQPKFAKNGSRVFFTYDKDDIGHNVLAYIDLDRTSASSRVGPEIRYHVTAKFVPEKYPAFFPIPYSSGEELIYQRNKDGKREILIIDLSSGKSQIIDEGMSPSLSKDEQYIAYTKKVNDNWDIYVYQIKTKKIIRVTSDSGKDFSPVFDRLNNLYFTSDIKEPGVFSIYKKDMNVWNKGRPQTEVYLSKKGVSFYAPRISGYVKASLESLPDMVAPSRSSFGAISHQGKIFVVGGHQGPEHTYPKESFSDRVEYFDTKTNTWYKTTPRPVKAHGFALAAYGDYIYAFGGFAFEESTNPKWKSLDRVDRYHIPSHTWEFVGHMPRKRSSNVVAQVGNRAYIIGGWDSTPKFDNDIDGIFHDEVDVFNMETLTFETLKVKLPLKRRAFTGVVKDGLIYLIGGKRCVKLTCIELTSL